MRASFLTILAAAIPLGAYAQQPPDPARNAQAQVAAQLAAALSNAQADIATLQAQNATLAQQLKAAQDAAAKPSDPKKP